MEYREAVLTVLNRLNATQNLDITDHGKHYPSAVSTPAIHQHPDRVENIQHPQVSALRKTHLASKTPQIGGDTPLSRSRANVSHYYRTAILKKSSTIELGTSQETSSYIKTVLWACLSIQLFVHPSLLHLLPIPIIYSLLKKAWKYLGQSVIEICSSQWQKCCHFANQRKDALLPEPVKFVLKELYKLERDLMNGLPRFLDTIVACLMIFAMIVGVVLTVVFITFQMYTETIYIVQTSGKLMTSVTNSSFYQQMNASLGGDHAYFKGMEDLMESGYVYGREYISSSVVSFFKSNDGNNAESVDEFEKKLLELWDRIYQYWLAKNDHLNVNLNEEQVVQSQVLHGPQISSEALTSSMEEVIHRVLAILDLSAFSQFTMKNMGTLISIVEQGWSLIKGNLGFALTVISEILRIIFQGGSGMVNLFLSVIVYFTALFYLLSSNGKEYKPVEIISNCSGLFMGNQFATVMKKAINR